MKKKKSTAASRSICMQAADSIMSITQIDVGMKLVPDIW